MVFCLVTRHQLRAGLFSTRCCVDGLTTLRIQVSERRIVPNFFWHKRTRLIVEISLGAQPHVCPARRIVEHRRRADSAARVPAVRSSENIAFAKPENLRLLHGVVRTRRVERPTSPGNDVPDSRARHALDTTGGWQRSHRVFTCARNYFSKALTLTVDFADDSALARRRFSLSIIYILVRLLTSCAAKRLWTEPGTMGRGHACRYGSLPSLRSCSASSIVLELLILASFICNRLLELAFIVVCGNALVGCSAGSFNADSSLRRIREALLCICKDVCSGLASRFFEARNELGEYDLLRLV